MDHHREPRAANEASNHGRLPGGRGRLVARPVSLDDDDRRTSMAVDHDAALCGLGDDVGASWSPTSTRRRSILFSLLTTSTLAPCWSSISADCDMTACAPDA